MTVNTAAHTNCTHETTKAARAVCRKARLAAASARYVRALNIVAQLDRPFGSGNLLHRVCVRYGCDHVNHATTVDCGEAIVDYIDYTRVHSNYIVPENGIEHHAYRMFS